MEFQECKQAKSQTVYCCRVPPEDVGLHVLVGVGVALGDEGDGHPQVGPLQDQILS